MTTIIDPAGQQIRNEFLARECKTLEQRHEQTCLALGALRAEFAHYRRTVHRRLLDLQGDLAGGLLDLSTELSDGELEHIEREGRKAYELFTQFMNRVDDSVDDPSVKI